MSLADEHRITGEARATGALAPDGDGAARPTVRRRSLPAGATTIAVHELRGATAGPTVALLGGIHGDEPEGVLAVRRVGDLLRDRPLRGRLLAVPVANPLAHAADRRCAPQDGGDLARSFPGAADGGPTAAIARALTDGVIAGADLLIDLHSAGRRQAMPLFCGYVADAGGDGPAARLARAFGTDLVWRHDAVGPGRTLTAARDHGVPALYVEASGGGEVRGSELDRIVAGVLRVLAALGMLDPDAVPSATTVPRLITGGDGDTDRGLSSPAEGTLVTRTTAGALVARGGLVAEIWSDDGQRTAVVAPAAGIVMLLRREARVGVGESLAMIAPAPIAWPA